MTNKKDLSLITHDMSEHDRANYLKDKYINIITNSYSVNDIHVHNKTKGEIRKMLRQFAKDLNSFREYYDVGDTNINAFFSGNNLDESISKTADVSEMFIVIFNLDVILKNAIKIEEHVDIKKDYNIKLIHELLSIIKIDNEEIIIIKITIKESRSPNTNNILYSITNLEKKKITSNLLSTSKSIDLGAQSGSRLSTIILSLLISHVNNSDVLRYIPNELLTAKQIVIKEEGIKRYNEKKNTKLIKRNSI